MDELDTAISKSHDKFAQCHNNGFAERWQYDRYCMMQFSNRWTSEIYVTIYYLYAGSKQFSN